MLNATDGHVCLMDLRSSAGAILCRVARLLASMASAGKRTNADTVSGTPATSTPNAAASVVDLVAIVARVTREISPPAIDHNRLESCGHGHFHGVAPLFLLGIPEVRSNIVNCSLASPL